MYRFYNPLCSLRIEPCRRFVDVLLYRLSLLEWCWRQARWVSAGAPTAADCEYGGGWGGDAQHGAGRGNRCCMQHCTGAAGRPTEAAGLGAAGSWAVVVKVQSASYVKVSWNTTPRRIR